MLGGFYRGNFELIIKRDYLKGGVFIGGLFLGDRLFIFMNFEVFIWGSVKYIFNVF